MQSSTTAPLPRTRVLALGPPLFDSLFPGSRVWHKFVAIAVLVLLIAVCAKARFYLPENPTPVTLQTFGVLFAGSLMGWRWGSAAVLSYIVVGALGAPVFASQSAFDFRSPIEAWDSTIMGVTGGYILGFLVASSFAGVLSQLGFTHRDTLWANLAGGILLYIPALIWLAAFDFGWPQDGRLFMDGMYVFMPGDLLKILAVSLITWGLWSRVTKSRG